MPVQRFKVVSVQVARHKFNAKLDHLVQALQVKNLYLKLHDFLENDKIFKEYSSKYLLDLDLYSKKIMGQIVFCYFIQKLHGHKII